MKKNRRLLELLALLALLSCASAPKRPYESEYFKRCKLMCEHDGDEARGIQETETAWKCFCEKRPDPT